MAPSSHGPLQCLGEGWRPGQGEQEGRGTHHEVCRVPSPALQFTTSSTSFSSCLISSKSRVWHLYRPLLLLFTSCRFSTPLLVSASDVRSCQLSSSCRPWGKSRALSPTQAPSIPAAASHSPGPSRQGTRSSQDTRCLPRERCPGSLWPHLSLIEAEDGCWVPVGLTDQLHVIPFLHQCRGWHDLQLHVLRRVWGRRECRCGAPPRSTRQQARPPAPDSQKTVTLTCRESTARLCPRSQ